MFATNYLTAVNWIDMNRILCNDIVKVDPEIYDEMRFDYYDEEEDEYMEIYQWYLTSLSLSEVVFLEEHFGLHFTYSNLLDLFVLCVPHFGTPWSGVYWETDLPQAASEKES